MDIALVEEITLQTRPDQLRNSLLADWPADKLIQHHFRNTHRVWTTSSACWSRWPTHSSNCQRLVFFIRVISLTRSIISANMASSILIHWHSITFMKDCDYRSFNPSLKTKLCEYRRPSHHSILFLHHSKNHVVDYLYTLFHVLQTRRLSMEYFLVLPSQHNK